jgi:hypothetical protein
MEHDRSVTSPEREGVTVLVEEGPLGEIASCLEELAFSQDEICPEAVHGFEVTQRRRAGGQRFQAVAG